MARGSKLFGHPLHPMLVHIPVVLLPGALLCDVIGVSVGEQGGFWFQAAAWALRIGLIGALLAAVAGLMEFLTIPSRTKAKSTALYHMVVNVLGLIPFAVATALRNPSTGGDETAVPGLMLWEALGTILLVVGGVLGSKLSYKLGVGQYRDEKHHGVAPYEGHVTVRGPTPVPH